MSITKSPVHSHLSEIKDGLVSVRALGLQAVDTGAMLGHIDYANKPRYYRDLTLCWLGVRLQSISSILSGAVAVAAVLASGVPALSFMSASPGMMAVVLSTTLTMSNVMRWCVEQGERWACTLIRRVKVHGSPTMCLCVRVATISVTQAEAELSRVERMQHFISLQPEAPLHGGAGAQHPVTGKPVVQPPAAWPTRGRVEFKNVVLRYGRRGEARGSGSDMSDAALKGVSFVAEAGQRLAVVGRSGAGKSSLVKALVRLTEPSSGAVLIDGVDVGAIGLRDLRSKLSIIPQVCLVEGPKVGHE